jgi:transposase InsO family protein
MKAQGIRGRKKHRRKPRTTDSLDTHVPAPTRPNQIWVTDITCILTAEGWLYLPAIVDLWSRRVVGWSCSPSMHVSLVLNALHKALALCRPPKGVLHHSDRGSQYAACEYIAALAAAGFVASMSRAGNCYANAAMESFRSTCKTDTRTGPHRRSHPPRRRACHLRLHRNLLQPDEVPQLAGSDLPCGF